jgi:hypothetical protein
VPSLFDVKRRSPKSVNQEIPQPLLSTRKILGRIHWTQQIIRRYLPIESRYQALKSLRPDNRINLMFFHSFNRTRSLQR